MTTRSKSQLVLFCVILFFQATLLFAQELTAGLEWIFFKDKGPAVTGAIHSVVLTERSLARRRQGNPQQPTGYRDVPVYSGYIAAVRSTGAQIRTRSRWFNGVSVLATDAQLAQIGLLDCVKDIRPVQASYRSTPEEPQLPGLLRTAAFDSSYYGYTWEQLRQINIPLAHASGYSGEGVIVLMVDTGYDLSHPVFDSLVVLAEWDFIQNDDNTADDPGDKTTQDDHGTEVLSVIAGYRPGEYVGPAFRAQYLLAKTEIVTSEAIIEEDYYVAALEWGDSLGADVASSSVGYNDWYTYEDLDGNTAITTRAVDYAASIGITCVNSMGNEGANRWYYMLAPADADSVIAVGNVTATGMISSTSSRGPTYDGRIKPEVCARGSYTLVCNPDGINYFGISGTSYAAPLIGGAAALILSAHPTWTPAQVRRSLIKTASRANLPDNSYGYGIANVWAAINYTGFFVPESPATLIEELIVYPNPAADLFTVRLEIYKTGDIDIAVYNLLGQQVAELHQGTIPAGCNYLAWRPVTQASGIYFIRARAAGHTITRKCILIKQNSTDPDE